MKLKLNNASIKALQPGQTRYRVSDTGEHGLELRVSPSGRKTFYVSYRFNGKVQRKRIGPWPDVRYKEAKLAAAEIRRMVLRGHDPQSEERSPIVSEVLKRYVAQKSIENPKRAKAIDDLLTSNLLPKHSARKIGDVKQGELRALLDAVSLRAQRKSDRYTGASQQHQVLSALRGLWRFALEHDLTEKNPTQYLSSPKLRKRTRVLTDDEIIRLWDGLEAAPTNQRLGLRILLLTAQRRSELALAQWRELDLERGVWTLPEERAKNGNSHRIPLSTRALDLFCEARDLSYPSDYVFPGRGKLYDKPINPTTLTIYLDRHREDLGLADVRCHDLRRTAISSMARLGVRREVARAILNHMDNDATSHYWHAELYDQKADALQRWADYVTELLAFG